MLLLMVGLQVAFLEGLLYLLLLMLQLPAILQVLCVWWWLWSLHALSLLMERWWERALSRVEGGRLASRGQGLWLWSLPQRLLEWYGRQG